jgi:hypothetical protein
MSDNTNAARQQRFRDNAEARGLIQSMSGSRPRHCPTCGCRPRCCVPTPSDGRPAVRPAVRQARLTAESEVTLAETFALFRRLGVNAQALSERDLRLYYLGLARRYHPDCGSAAHHELVANINCAKTTILQSYRRSRQ